MIGIEVVAEERKLKATTALERTMTGPTIAAETFHAVESHAFGSRESRSNWCRQNAHRGNRRAATTLESADLLLLDSARTSDVEITIQQPMTAAAGKGSACLRIEGFMSIRWG